MDGIVYRFSPGGKRRKLSFMRIYELLVSSDHYHVYGSGDHWAWQVTVQKYPGVK